MKKVLAGDNIHHSWSLAFCWCRRTAPLSLRYDVLPPLGAPMLAAFIRSGFALLDQGNRFVSQHFLVYRTVVFPWRLCMPSLRATTFAAVVDYDGPQINVRSRMRRVLGHDLNKRAHRSTSYKTMSTTQPYRSSFGRLEGSAS